MNPFDVIAATLAGADNEGTSAPYWMLIDPSLLDHRDADAPVNDNEIRCCIEGPFFSRADADAYLRARRYDYSDRAVIWCLSGYRSAKYVAAYRALKEGV